MNHSKYKACITFVALLLCLPWMGKAQESRKDTLDTFLFEFIDAPSPVSPLYTKGVIHQIDLLLTRDKNLLVEQKIKLLVIGSEAYLNLKRTHKAEEFIDRAHLLAKKQGNKKLQALVSLQHGDFFRGAMEKEKALDSYQEAIANARSAGEDLIEAEAYLHLGMLLRADENQKQAITAYEQTISISKKNKHYALMIKALYLRSAIYRDLSRKQEALADVNEAFAIASANKSSYLPFILNIKGSIHYRFGEIDLGIQNYRSGQSHLNTQPFKEDLQATLQENIALCLKEKLRYNQAKAILDSALTIRKFLADTIALAKNYTQQGNLSLQLGKYADALEYYLIALELRQKAGTSADIATSQTSIGLLYRNLGLNDKAIVYFKDALNQRREQGSNMEIGEAFTHLGNAYFDVKNFKEALECYKSALGYREKTKDKALEARSLNSIATVYQEMKNFKKAESSFLEALKTNTSTDIKGRAIICNNLGNFYLAINNKEKALINFYSAIRLHKRSQNLLGEGLALRKIGEIYFGQKKYSKADSCLIASMQVGKVAGNLEHLKNTNLALYRLYFEQKDYPKALNYYIAFAQLQDSIGKTKSSDDLINARLSVEMERKKADILRIENEITVLKKEAQLQESESKRQWYIVIFLIATSLLLIILGSVLFRAYRLKKQKATLLQEKYTISKIANEQLEKSEESLKRLNATKDKFFAIIAHDLKSPFNALLGLSELLKLRATELTPNEVLEYGNAMHSSSAKLFSLIENLLQWARTQTGKIPFKPIVFDLNELLTSNISIQDLAAKNKNITIEVETIEDFKVEADLEMVNTVLRNLLTNAVKFTPSGGAITIATIAKNNHVTISVTDTGSGMTQEEMNLLFRLDVHHTTKGTEDESGTGLGLIICKEFVEQNQGEITVSSQVGKGTTFSFTLPIRKTT